MKYPTRDDQVYLVNGVLIRPKEPTPHAVLKGEIFKGPIKNKIRIKSDLEITAESNDTEASYKTMVIVEAEKNTFKSNPPSAIKKTFSSLKRFFFQLIPGNRK